MIRTVFHGTSGQVTKVIVIPTTDGFGTEKYNAELKRKGAAEAIRLIGVPASKVEVVMDGPQDAVATTPMQRVMQRTVRLRILHRYDQ